MTSDKSFYFGKSENDYLHEIVYKWKTHPYSHILDKRTEDHVRLRSHVRFDLRKDNLPRFSIYENVWSKVIEEILFINDTLKICSTKNLSLAREIENFESQISINLDELHKYAIKETPYKILGSQEIILQLGETINQLKKDPYSRRLVVCSLDPCKKDRLINSHMIFQFIINFHELIGCLYLTSCDLASHLPLKVVFFSLLISIVGRAINIEPGELVVFVEQTLISHSAFALTEQILNLPVPKLKILKSECNDFLPKMLEDGSNIAKELFLNQNLISLHEKVNDGQETNVEEASYLNLLKDIITHGCLKPNRTGIDTRSLTGVCMVYNLRKGIIPVLTTKRVFWKGVVEELLWFIRGSTNAKELAEKGVHIWDANGSRHFLDSLGFTDREEGDLGPVYGFQWRHFGAEYRGMREDYSGEGVDQLKEVIENLKKNLEEGPMMVTSWNNKDLSKMALPSCHVAYHFTVSGGELSCSMYQRSADMGLGVPFNIASYSLLTHMVAHVTGLKTGDFVHYIGDAHVYENHVEPLGEQINERPRTFPRLVFKRNVSSINDYQPEDFQLIGHRGTKRIELKMAL